MTLAATLRRLARDQHDAWFAPLDPRALAIGRIMIFGYIWPGFTVPDYAVYAEFGGSSWYPVSFFKAWSVPLLGGDALQLLSLVSTVTLLFAALGLSYRISAPVAALSTLYLHGVPQNFGKINHSGNLLMLALLVFACARAADAWSVDAGLRKLRSAPAVEWSGAHRWPMRFVALLIVTMYASAGISKLKASGWDWALSDSFQRLLLRHHFTHHPPTDIGLWVAEMPLLCNALALLALSTELAAPLALIGRWPFALLIGALFAMQCSIALLMGVAFTAMLPLFLCLLPWPVLLSRLDGLRRRGQ
jgi:hypothetical protein